MTVNDSPSPPETVLSETHGDPRITVHEPVGTLGDCLRRLLKTGM